MEIRPRSITYLNLDLLASRCTLSSGLSRNLSCSSLYLFPLICSTVTTGNPICRVHVSIMSPTSYSPPTACDKNTRALMDNHYAWLICDYPSERCFVCVWKIIIFFFQGKQRTVFYCWRKKKRACYCKNNSKQSSWNCTHCYWGIFLNIVIWATQSISKWLINL